MSTAGLILAAGESRRMGSPKPLMRYRGATFLDGLIEVFNPHCSPVIVVLGAAADQIRAGTTGPAMFVHNADYLSGQTSSMQCGLRAVPAGAEGVLFTLVDHPSVSPSTIEALLAGGSDSLVRIPRYHGERGHPIWFHRSLIPEILSLPATGAARDIIRAHRPQTWWVDVDDPGIVADIDDPAAYRNLIEAGA